MSKKREPRNIRSLICIKCGQDSIEQGDVGKHGIGRCTKSENREKVCPLCFEDFADYHAVKMELTDWRQSNDQNLVRYRDEVLRREPWAAKKIYAHKIRHRQNGDTVENFA